MTSIEEPAEPSPQEAARARDRRSARNAVKLAALVRDRWGVDAPADSFGTGAALVADGVAHVLVDAESDHGLGAALAWMRRHRATALRVIADDAPGTIARQAAEFATDISVWTTRGRDLVAVEAEPLAERVGPPDAPDLVALLEAEGLEVVVEGDRLAGEFRGLEVVRIVRAVDDGEPILEVGVGRYDRVMTAMMHGDLDGRASIARVVDQLRAVRRPDGPPNHPLATLVPERWLRTTLLAEPELIGCSELHPTPSVPERDRLRPRQIAAAIGTCGTERVVVACSVGIDLEAVVAAADTRLAADPEATLVLALPARDVLPTTEALVADLVRPARIVAIDGDWKR